MRSFPGSRRRHRRSADGPFSPGAGCCWWPSLFRAVNEVSFDRSVPNNWLWFGGSFPPLHLPTFLIGMAVGRLFLFGPRLSTKTHVRIFVIAVMATVALLAARQRVPPWALSTPIIVSLFYCVIYGGARIGNSFKPLTGPTFLLLGEASYALYIVHPGMTWWWERISRFVGLDLPFPLSVIVAAGLAIVASVLCCRYVEVPLRRQILLRRLPAAFRFSQSRAG
jgi:peptidoglycan/LPS O-acetylase OafA/YrhL